MRVTTITYVGQPWIPHGATARVKGKLLKDSQEVVSFDSYVEEGETTVLWEGDVDATRAEFGTYDQDYTGNVLVFTAANGKEKVVQLRIGDGIWIEYKVDLVFPFSPVLLLAGGAVVVLGILAFMKK